MKINLLEFTKTEPSNFIRDGLPFVFSVWIYCKNGEVIEIYDHNIVILSRFIDFGDCNNDFFDRYYDSGVQDLFECDDNGLYFVSGKVSSQWDEDYYGEVDHYFIIEEIFTKEKCVNFSHLKWVYQNIIKVV